VHPRSDPSAQLLGLAQAQGGVITVGQADELGLGRHARARLLRGGQWQRVGGTVVAVHSFPLSWTAQAWAGVLLAGTGARLAGPAAAHLHGLTDAAPGRIDVLGPYPVPDRQPWSFHRERVGVRDSRSPGDPPRTTLDDTVLDLCAGADPQQMVQWVTAAVQSRRTSPARLRRALERRSRYADRALLLELLGDVRQGADSPLELRYLRDVERPHGLPRGERQQVSRHRHRRDVYYRLYRVVVELDGRLGHEGMGRFRDMARDNSATVDGEASLRYGYADVAGSCCAVAWQVGSVLAARGWAGPLRRCSRCASVPDNFLG
jgi:hypothetical protein